MLHCHHMVTFSEVFLFDEVVFPLEKNVKYALPFHLDRFNCILQIDRSSTLVHQLRAENLGKWLT